MEVQLQELIDKIKQDGILVADEKATEIIKVAENKAKSIIKEAENKAEIEIKKAETEAKRFQKAAEDSIKQASRNTLIAFKQGIIKQLETIINKETKNEYNAEVLKKLIPETVKSWVKINETQDLTVVLSENDAKYLEDSLITVLKDTISKGIEVKSDNKMTGGFRIGTKDGAAYYDFSAEAVAEMFASYLSPKTAEILKEASKEI